MTDFLSLFVKEALAYLSKYLPAWLIAILEDIFNEYLKRAPAPAEDDVIRVGAAPDEVRASLRKRFTDFINQALADFGIARRMVLRYLTPVLDTIINNGWDRWFAPQIHAGTMKAAASHGFTASTARDPSLQPAPVSAPSDDELAEVKAELAKVGKVKPDHAKHDHGKPDHTRPDHAKEDHTKQDHAKVGKG